MRSLVLGCSLALAFAPQPAPAQSFSRLRPGEQAVTLEAGVESGVRTSVGYAAGLRVDALDRTVMPFIQGTFVGAHPDLGDYALTAGAQVSLFRTGWFDLSSRAALQVQGTQNSIHGATALGTDVTVLAGHHARRWCLLAEAGWHHAWLTYLESTSFYRALYPEARDGWYGNTAGTLRVGLKGGVRVGGVEALVRAGANKSEGLNGLAFPFYATLGASYRF